MNTSSVDTTQSMENFLKEFQENSLSNPMMFYEKISEGIVVKNPAGIFTEIFQKSFIRILENLSIKFLEKSLDPGGATGETSG